MLVLANEISSHNDECIGQLLILSDACDIILTAMLLLIVEIEVGAFLQSVDRPFTHTSSCSVCTVALQMVSVCMCERACLAHAAVNSDC